MILGIDIEWWIFYGLIIFSWAFLALKAEHYRAVLERMNFDLEEIDKRLLRCEDRLQHLQNSMKDPSQTDTNV